MPSALHEAFDVVAAENPGQVVRFPSEREELTYAELADSSRAMAAGLAEAGAGPGDTIGILSPNAPAFLQAVFAASRIGATACPLPLPMSARDLAAYVRRTQGIVDTAGAKHLVCTPALLPLAEHLTGVRQLDASKLTASGDPRATVSPDSPAVIQFTSGSTAAPKGVILTHANVLHCAGSIIEAIRLSPADSHGTWLPMFHDMGLFGTLTGLLRGLKITIWSPAAFVKSPAAWLAEFLDARATICAMPNFAYDYLVTAVRAEEAARLDMSHWRVAFNGAESIAARSVRAFLDHFPGFRAESMLPGYGMAEATLVATLPPLGRAPIFEWVDRAALSTDGRAVPAEGPDARGIVSLGRAVPGARVRVVEPGGDLPREDGEVGEIQIQGGSVSRGYLGDVAQPFTVDGWLRTGDLGYLRDGELFFTGRSKEMITVRGLNVYPLDVETVAHEVPGIRKGRCVAFALAEQEQIVLVAETALSDDGARTELANEIVTRIRAVLGLTELDVRLVRPRTIPRTTSGKLQRLAMKERILAEAAR